MNKVNSDNPAQALLRAVLAHIIADIEQKYGMDICEYVKTRKGGAYEKSDRRPACFGGGN